MFAICISIHHSCECSVVEWPHSDTNGPRQSIVTAIHILMDLNWLKTEIAQRNAKHIALKMNRIKIANDNITLAILLSAG